MNTKEQANKAAKYLETFITRNELQAIKQGMRGEEGQHFIDTLVEFENRIKTMPKTYEQDGKGNEAVAYLHYFHGGCDWYIIEKDAGDEEERAIAKNQNNEPPQSQAFGYASLGYGFEAGYISIAELLQNNVELDLFFQPTTIGQLQECGKIKEMA